MKQMLSKVPEVTIYFWIIKILCTTVGETVADYLNETLNFGLTGTSLVMGAVLIVVLFFQFKARKYVPSIYWLSVVLISVVGTLITDNLTDKLNVSLQTTTIVFSIALALTFLVWYIVEKTLSVHSIVTTRREAFYWLAILFTFALGTASGDLSAEKFGLGYLTSVFIFAGLIGTVTIAYFVSKKFLGRTHQYRSASAILTFWLAYIFTRPLGASIGDYLSQARTDGGIGLGTMMTSALFLILILALVVYLTFTRKDEILTARSLCVLILCMVFGGDVSANQQFTPILLYHHINVLPAHMSKAMRRWSLSPEKFESQLDWVEGHGFHTVTMEQLIDHLKHGLALPPKPIVLSFDDGLKEHYSVVFPILKKYHLVGTFFIITDSVGHSAFMNWKQILEMRDDGMDIEAHTLTHPNLSTLSHEEAVNEILGSKEILERHLKKPVPVLAYPYGCYNDDTIAIAKAAGFEGAARVSGINIGYLYRADQSYTLERFAIEGNESLDYLAHIKGFDSK